MRSDPRPNLLDVTRLVERSWTRRPSSGIDRVCEAYLDHFSASSLAVVQHRGVVRVLDAKRSDRLFGWLANGEEGFRAKCAALLGSALAGAGAQEATAGQTYINVSHTDFDLPAHWEWVERSGLRSVYFIHDLIPILHPEYSRPHAVRRHRGRVELALRRADHLVTGSQAVARDLRTFAKRKGLRLPPVTVAPIAGHEFVGTAKVQHAPYFLCIGTIEPRKNHALLFQVWRALVDRMGRDAPRLVIIGQKGPMTGDILAPLAQDAVLREHIEHHEGCSDDELGRWMAGAEAVLFPSLAEGFGLPLVEALAMGKPVLASDIPIFREIAQGCAHLLDPSSCDNWADAVKAIHCGAPGKSTTARFKSPDWPSHFASLENALDAQAASSGLQSSRPCESSLAA